jgi:hypothetical protein
MEGRRQVRAFLAGRHAERAPFLPLVTDFAARLQQVSRAEMLADPQTLTRTLVAAQALFDLDAVALQVDRAHLATAAEAARRLRVLLGERAALVVLLPAPELELARALELEHVDVLGVLAADVEPDGLAPLWNVARYYAVPSLLVCPRGTTAAAGAGADAVAVWDGATAKELLAAGAPRAGVPIAPGGEPPPLPAGGFYITAGELPAEADVDWFHRITRAVAP